MDQHVQKLLDVKLANLQRVCQLKRYGFNVVEDSESAVNLIESMLNQGDSVSVGGSMTLFETNIIQSLEDNQNINYLDRYHCDVPADIYRQVFTSDVYITSTNALTMNGELYNIDGNGNRVAAMIYGPKKVIVVCGINKIVKDMDAARVRMKEIAAPSNNIRLQRDNPCTKVGHCVNCDLPTRICSSEVVISRSHEPLRIHIVVIKENLGY